MTKSERQQFWRSLLRTRAHAGDAVVPSSPSPFLTLPKITTEGEVRNILAVFDSLNDSLPVSDFKALLTVHPRHVEIINHMIKTMLHEHESFIFDLCKMGKDMYPSLTVLDDLKDNTWLVDNPAGMTLEVYRSCNYAAKISIVYLDTLNSKGLRVYEAAVNLVSDDETVITRQFIEELADTKLGFRFLENRLPQPVWDSVIRNLCSYLSE